MRLSAGIGLFALAGTIFATAITGPAHAELQRWSVLYLDANGNPTSYGSAKSAEAYATNQKGYVLSIGCAAGGGYSIAAEAPDGEKADFGGPEVEPSFRISKPGTDLFLGPIGKMTFDGKRYTGQLPDEAIAPLRERIKDGLVTWTEFTSRTTIAVRSQRADGAIGELNCK